jgi:hypothetical protein
MVAIGWTCKKKIIVSPTVGNCPTLKSREIVSREIFYR